jgi:hypothetical protein
MGKHEILFLNSISAQVRFQAVPGAISSDIIPCFSAHTANADHLLFFPLPHNLCHDYLPNHPL